MMTLSPNGRASLTLFRLNYQCNVCACMYAYTRMWVFLFWAPLIIHIQRTKTLSEQMFALVLRDNSAASLTYGAWKVVCTYYWQKQHTAPAKIGIGRESSGCCSLQFLLSDFALGVCVQCAARWNFVSQGFLRTCDISLFTCHEVQYLTQMLDDVVMNAGLWLIGADVV
jgi:hypothetical protein